jgi:hypothetical protein
MGTMTCTKCGVVKNVESFAWKNKAKARRHLHCKECQKAISGSHYEENKVVYIDRAIKRYSEKKQENEASLKSWISNRACTNCGEANPAILKFVRKKGESSKVSVYRALGNSWEAVLEQIEKSDLLCVGCRRTGNRLV